MSMPWPLLILGYVAIVTSSADTTLELVHEGGLQVPFRSYVTSPFKYYAALAESRNLGLLENKRGISVLSRWKPLTSALSSLRPVDINSLRSMENRRYFSRSASLRPHGTPLRYGRR